MSGDEAEEPGWVVRAGRGGAHVDEFVDDGFVGLGYGAALGDLPDVDFTSTRAPRFETRS